MRRKRERPFPPAQLRKLRAIATIFALILMVTAVIYMRAGRWEYRNYWSGYVYVPLLIFVAPLIFYAAWFNGKSKNKDEG
jgi:hypothetical protein